MLLFTIFFALFLHFSVATKISLTKTYEHAEKEINIDFREQTKLFYLRCNSSLPKLGRRCIVTVENDAFDKINNGDRKECAVILKPELRYGLVIDWTAIKSFDSDKVVLFWWEIQYAFDSKYKIERFILKSTVVHVFDSCRTFETKVQEYFGEPADPYFYFSPEYWDLTMHINNFDIIIGYTKNNCTSPSKCFDYRLHKFDKRGRKIDESKPWLEPPFNGNIEDYRNAIPLKSFLPEKKYLIVHRNRTGFTKELLVKQSSGSQQSLIWKSPDNEEGSMWSQGNKSISLCHEYPKSHFDCWKSDMNGQIYMKKVFVLQTQCEWASFGFQNLRNGGLLLLFYKCKDLKKARWSHVNSENDIWEIMEINPNGNINSVEVRFDTACQREDNNPKTSILENKQGQYCIFRSCGSRPKNLKNRKSRLEIQVRCYSKDELSKCSNCL